MVLVWRITDDSPNSPNFFPAKLSRYTVTACMYKNSMNNTTLWLYLGTKRLDFRHENNSTSGVLIEEIQ